MEIIRVSSKEFAGLNWDRPHVFQTSEFNDLNKSKCDEVLYFLFKEGKYRLGIVFGKNGNTLLSPFSAPFGGFISISANIKLQYIEEAIKTLIIWAKENNIKSINITLPPEMYYQSFISKQINCLWREGFDILNVDLNYAFDTNFFDDNYIRKIQYNARKNLKVAFKSDFRFSKCIDDTEKEIAYNVIKKNRKERGFPLRMTWQQVKETTEIIESDFFLLRNENDVEVASAIVFHVSDNIVQVIYWGDIPEFSIHRTMNFLSYKVFEYYKSRNVKIVDVGPSTEDSVPNYGLAEFKESIGCFVSPKYKFSFDI